MIELTYESEGDLLTSGVPMIVPILLWEVDGILHIEAYEGVRSIAETFADRFAKHPFSTAAMKWLDEMLTPFCNAHGYYRESRGRYRWYHQYTYGEPVDGVIQSTSQFWEGTPSLSGLLLDLDPAWPTFVTVVDGVIVSAARTNEYDPDESTPEITVETAVGHRGKGYGASNVAALAAWLAEREEYPQYVCSRYNHASAKVAQRAGFRKAGKIYAFTAYKD